MPTEEPCHHTPDTFDEATARERADRARAVEETAGALSGVYEPEELQRLRDEWPT